MQNLTFKNITSQHIQDCFIKTYQQFTALHDHPFSFEQLSLKNYTMRAQPVINWAFWHRATRHYRVQTSDHLQLRKYIRMEELPENVLIGWFAHELGHIMDYHNRSALNLISFVVRYLAVPNYRMGAERRADLYAIDHGFGDALMATKRYILEQSKLPDQYKQRIKRYYLSPTELETILKEKESELTEVLQ
ncbi:MAG: hypothetical protein ACRBG0_25050 [Lewinella sp.]|jgi:hypothetical protein|uniref:hypothetical protein n=1 Tax=Lewinella sp. TaxID=2004506 RepID=UPI003D6AB7D0